MRRGLSYQEPMSPAKERQTSSTNFFKVLLLKPPYMESVNINVAVTRYVT